MELMDKFTWWNIAKQYVPLKKYSILFKEVGPVEMQQTIELFMTFKDLI